VSSHYYRFCLEGPEPQRAPLLERLLARADSVCVIDDWRADAYRCIAPDTQPMPAIAGTALCADGIIAQGGSVYLATPVHYAAEMSNVRLAADGIVALDPAVAAALAADFNRIWQDAGVRLLAGRSARLYCVFERRLDAVTQDPQSLLGQPIENFLPAGADASRLRRLMSEIEMWLFEHAVNRSRGSAAAITGLWLWGGGGLIQSLPSVSGWTLGHDVFFSSIATRAARAATVSGVAVIAAQPGSQGWLDAEPWLAQSAADWRSGGLERLELCAGERRVRVGRAGRWRWWRRPRAWWEHFV
jgi:hypothetical protein